MTQSKIEWTGRSDWNPIRGCTRKSAGCVNCYAEIMAARFSKEGQWGHGFAHMVGGDHRWTGKVEVQWDRLLLPLSWRTPAMIFGSSTSDIFHEALPWNDIAQIIGVAVAAHHLRGHVIQFLTKRSDRMAKLLNEEQFWDAVNTYAGALVMERVDPLDRRSDDARATIDDYGPDKPAPGVWFGVSVEDQETADERIPDLLKANAAVRFLSCEPLLGPVDLTDVAIGERRYGVRVDATTGLEWDDLGARHEWSPINWVIAGGESGHGARPMHPDWVRMLRDQCAATGTAFFFKQWGEWVPDIGAVDGWTIPDNPEVSRFDHRDWEGDHWGEPYARGWMDDVEPDTVSRIGKKLAGRMLDGVEHSGMPA